jgi:Na+-driven multidrug efflux pump
MSTNNASKTERLGTERIGKLLWEMSSQTTFSLLVYAIYSITDTYFLSVGVNALAAAGASIIAPVLMALGGVATIVGVGGASVVSRALGQKNVERASRTVANTHLIFWTVALAISVFGALFITPLVYLLGATDSIAPYAIEYGRIIFLGAITSTGFSAIVRADGNVRYSTALWVIPVGVNVVLSWLFVMVLGMGAARGSAGDCDRPGGLRGMSAYFFFFRKGRTYDVKALYFKPDKAIIGEVLLIGLPSFLKSISASMRRDPHQQPARSWRRRQRVERLLPSSADSTAALNIPQTGIVQGMQPLVGYNFGQRAVDRVRRTLTLALRTTVVLRTDRRRPLLAVPGGAHRLLTQEPAILGAGQTALRCWRSPIR